MILLLLLARGTKSAKGAGPDGFDKCTFANQHTSLARPSPHLQLARRPVFASPVAPSLARPSPRLWLARRPVFASPVAPSSPRPSPRLRLARRPVFASPVASSSPRLCCLLGSGSAVLPNGLYAMGGTVAQAVWLKVDRRGNAPLGTPPLSMR
ncbi:hypothetical protein OUZ56_015409 [Daphnia magna]|uniref:Uncharacterized protein n=1 Tax=Daphnia magna TaxID=35525 RepID=A0ABR0AMS2_9CRUS|nr:hypothetical protein OUZ56_015409 [Daphnia magna]